MMQELQSSPFDLMCILCFLENYLPLILDALWRSVLEGADRSFSQKLEVCPEVSVPAVAEPYLSGCNEAGQPGQAPQQFWS